MRKFYLVLAYVALAVSIGLCGLGVYFITTAYLRTDMMAAVLGILATMASMQISGISAESFRKWKSPDLAEILDKLRSLQKFVGQNDNHMD